MFGWLGMWVILIIIGTFLRGPNWNFFGPFQYWDSHLLPALTNVNLSEYVWVKWLEQGLPKNIIKREIFVLINSNSTNYYKLNHPYHS